MVMHPYLLPTHIIYYAITVSAMLCCILGDRLQDQGDLATVVNSSATLAGVQEDED